MQSGGKYYSRYKKSRKGGGDSALTVRITIFTAMLLLACVLRFSDYPPLTRIRETAAAVLTTDGDYKGAVEVLGRALSGEQTEEDAIAVFGRKLFGLETEPGEQPTEPPAETTEPVTEPPATSQDTTQAGDFSGLTLAEQDYSFEAAAPVFAAATVFAEPTEPVFVEPEEEIDTTPNESFEIPTPDTVDDTVYAVAFETMPPAQGKVSSHFGYRTLSSSGETVFHHGVDIAVNTGTKVAAFAAGTVSKTGWSSVYGNYIRIEHEEGFESMYAHLSEILVKKGAKVSLGDKIALSGATGNVTGAHLHFELRKDGNIIDPLDYLSFE